MHSNSTNEINYIQGLVHILLSILVLTITVLVDTPLTAEHDKSIQEVPCFQVIWNVNLRVYIFDFFTEQILGDEGAFFDSCKACYQEVKY